MAPLKVYSHVRSGTHFLMAALWENFFRDDKTLERKPGFRGHWSRKNWESQQFYNHPMPWKGLFGGHQWGPRPDGIYIVRNGLDVLVSMYNVEQFHHVDKGIPSFKKWLRTPLDWHVVPSMRATKGRSFTPAEHWYRSTLLWLQERPPGSMIAYEVLYYHFSQAMGHIENFFHLKRIKDVWTRPPVVGFCSYQGHPGSWHHVFDGEDLDFFFSIVPQDYAPLAYSTPLDLPDTSNGGIPI